MQIRPGGLLAGLTAVLLVSCGSGVASPSSAPSPEHAITGFEPSDAAIRTSFANLDSAARDHPDALRQAAVRHLHDSNPQVHYAAVYSLALTVTSSQGSNEMIALLTSASLNDRLLAAAALTGIGDKRGLPVLIAALDQGDELSYWDPPTAAFEFARTELLYFTAQAFGLTASTDLASATAAQSSWERWWQTNQASILFDPSTGKYSP
jgi:hypothetical protein